MKIFYSTILFLITLMISIEAEEKDITVYTGQFDITDQVGDDETTLLGV